MSHPRIRSKLGALVGLVLASAPVVGCVGRGAPSDPYALPGRDPDMTAAAGASGLEGPAPDAGSKQSHFPLVDGATWTYRHTSAAEAPWDEVATLSASRYQGKDAFVLADEEDAEGARSRSTQVVDGTRVYRAYKEISVAGQVVVTTEYAPAFLRYDEDWTTRGLTVTLDDDWTETCVVASTASKCAPGAVKLGTTVHTYTVIDVAAKVSVPAGDFTAVEVQRENVVAGETKLFWFALGVGKVREENSHTGALEELSAYEIP